MASPWQGLLSTVSRPINRIGLASLLCGSLALLVGWIPYLQLFALLLSIAGLGLGLTGIVVLARQQAKSLVPATGLIISLPALGLATFGLFWGQNGKSPDHQQLLIPFRGQLNPSAAASPKSDWVDAGRNAVQQEDVRVRLVSATIRPVEVKDLSGKKRFTEKCLVIKLRISNAGAGRLIQYSGWDQTTSGDDSAHPLVYDPAGNTYAMKVFEPGQEVVGHVSSASIPPGKWVDDVLVFEPVPPRVEFLRLELPWKPLGMEGKVRLQIPARMITTKTGKKPGS